MIELIFLLAAVVCFGLVALGVGWSKVNLLGAGLFFFALSFLWPHLLLDLH